MAFKWVNPGYGELFTEAQTSTKTNSEANPRTNGVYISSCTCKTKFKSSNEIWIKASLFIYSYTYSDWGGLYIDMASSLKCGMYLYNANSIQIISNGQTVATFANPTLRNGALNDFVLHIKTGKEDGLIELSLNGMGILTYTGNVYNGDPLSFLYVATDSNRWWSNFIVSDTDISNENIAIVDFKEITGTWDGITDGTAKATDVGQTLSHTIDVDKLKEKMTVFSDNATITSICLSAKDIQYDATKVNALTASIFSGTSSLYSETKGINGNNTMSQAVYIKNMTADTLSNMKLELKTAKV